MFIYISIFNGLWSRCLCRFVSRYPSQQIHLELSGFFHRLWRNHNWAFGGSQFIPVENHYRWFAGALLVLYIACSVPAAVLTSTAPIKLHVVVKWKKIGVNPSLLCELKPFTDSDISKPACLSGLKRCSSAWCEAVCLSSKNEAAVFPRPRTSFHDV